MEDPVAGRVVERDHRHAARQQLERQVRRVRGHGERDADVAAPVELAGVAVVEQAEVLDARTEVVGTRPRAGGDDADVVAELALELVERERGDLPAVPPVPGTGVDEHGRRDRRGRAGARPWAWNTFGSTAGVNDDAVPP